MILILTFLLFTQKLEYNCTKGNQHVILGPGEYTVHCYGAQGGGAYANGKLNTLIGGRGAYTTGKMVLKGEYNFYIYVGGQGVPNPTDKGNKIGPNPGGYNGGGSSGKDTGFSNDDASGGGGGATDIRIKSDNRENIIMAAAGGSGAAMTCNGAPGGTFKGMKPTCADYDWTKCSNVIYVESDRTNQTSGGLNGTGEDGVDDGNIPGSGGGGGWMGGVAQGNGYGKYYFEGVSHSGSSYIAGYPGCAKSGIFNFVSDMDMKSDVQKGDGRVIIVFECPANCIECIHASKCSKCSNGYFLNSTYYCEKCLKNCSTCLDNKSCTKCSYKYYKFDNNKCYSDCSHANVPEKDLFYGLNKKTSTCEKCKADQCIDCSSDYETCTRCKNGYIVNETTKMCDVGPTQTFSQSQKFTPSNPFSETSDFTSSPKFSKSSAFSKSLEFAPSSEFSPSRHLPPTHEPVISDVKCSAIDEDKFFLLQSCDYTAGMRRFVHLFVLVDVFSGFRTDRSGSAVHVVDCGLSCNDTQFVDCVSNSGGGGAIYLRDTFKLTNNATFVRTNFTGCRAQYGGAVYMYASSDLFNITIAHCTFTSNKPMVNTPGRGADEHLFGGQALFLTVKKFFFSKCNFVLNKGTTAAIKVYNIFENTNAKGLLDESGSFGSFVECSFVQDKHSKSSILLVDGKEENRVNVVGCRFDGRLRKGSHYIEGNVADEKVLYVAACIFEHSSEDGVDIKKFEDYVENVKDCSKIITNNLIETLIAMFIFISLLIFAAINLVYSKRKSFVDEMKENSFNSQHLFSI